MIQLKQNNDIIYQGFTLNQDGFLATGTPSFKQWEEVGKFIKRSHEAVQFWRGDWLNYGEDHYEDWSQYFDEEEIASETLRKEKWVAKKIPLGRRRTNLSWSHHAEVADLEPEEQEKMFDFAEKNHLSVHKFRKAVTVYKMSLDAPELSQKDLEPTDPSLFKSVQEIIDSSIKTVELLEVLPLKSLHMDARDFLFSHLKKVIGFYLNTVQSYDKQKPLSVKVE